MFPDPQTEATMQSTFEEDVDGLTQWAHSAWRGTPAEMPGGMRLYSPGEQRENEQRMESSLKYAPPSFDEYRKLSGEQRSHFSLQVLRAMTGSGCGSGLNGRMKYLEQCDAVTERFVSEAKRFDAGLSGEEIHQALRNLWVFESILEYLGLPIVFTPSSFAYSLLYPYADNWLDAPERSKDEKLGLVQWLSKWFDNPGCAPVNEITGTVGRLLAMIREEFPVAEYPGVYGSLLAIHNAQRDSLVVQANEAEIDDLSLERHTIRKGGTSVLADGFLAAGSLEKEASLATFGYGVVLQLIDDLQDLEEDGRAGHSTPFLRFRDTGEIEKEARKLLAYSSNVSALIEAKKPDLGRLIADSSTLLALTAVCRNAHSFSRGFVESIQPLMPIRPAFLREMKVRISSSPYGQQNRIPWRGIRAA